MWEVCNAEPSKFIVFFKPMDQNSIFQAWFWIRMSTHFTSFCIWQYLSTIFVNDGSQVLKRAERDVQASFEGVAGEREELSFLSSPVRLPPSIDCPP